MKEEGREGGKGRKEKGGKQEKRAGRQDRGREVGVRSLQKERGWGELACLPPVSCRTAYSRGQQNQTGW